MSTVNPVDSAPPLEALQGVVERLTLELLPYKIKKP